MTRKHARLSPSDSVRWLNCGLAIEFDDANPEPEDSFDLAEAVKLWEEANLDVDALGPANRGTIAHAYGEQEIGGNLELPCPKVIIPESLITATKLDDNVETYIGLVTDFVNSRLLHDVGLERRIELWYEPGSFGTIDFSAYAPTTKTLFVIDYKSGNGRVSVIENTQLAIYGIGLYDEMRLFHEIEAVQYGIIQPALSAEIQWGEPLSLDALAEWRTRVNTQVSIINGRSQAPGVPGVEQCQWCRHRATCPERLRQFEEMLDFGRLEQATLDQVVAAWRKSELVRKFLNALEEYVRAHLAEIPSLGLAPPKINSWAFQNPDTALVAKYLVKLGFPADEIWKPRTLLSYSDLKALAKKLEHPDHVLAELAKIVKPEYAKTQRIIEVQTVGGADEKDIDALFGE